MSYQVSGVVQGVGFRRYVRGWARKLGLTGWVRNDAVGTVMVVAEGSDESLNRLVRLLHGGPPGAEVTSVASQITSRDDRLSGFEIRR